MLEIKDLCFNYSGSKHNVFEGFSLNLSEGNVYGLLGKNGTGKSTLLYLLCGMLRPKSGCVSCDGMETKLRQPDMLRNIFLLSEEFSMPPISLKRYVEINSTFYPRFSTEVLKKCLEDFELHTDLNLGELSMGQKKKAYISFALATRTKYLLMDEPTNGLDIPAKSQFRKVVANNMGEDQTIIISTHQVHDVEMLIDHVVMINNTGVLINSSLQEICEKYRFELRQPGTNADDVLYAEPSLQGNWVVVRNNDSEEDTPANLELLFNAVNCGLRI